MKLYRFIDLNIIDASQVTAMTQTGNFELLDF